MAKGQKNPITPRDVDYPQWYQDVIRESQLAEPAKVVKGCMVIRPHGYAVWERIQRDLDQRFKDTGHDNVYFPLLVPQSFITKGSGARRRLRARACRGDSCRW